MSAPFRTASAAGGGPAGGPAPAGSIVSIRRRGAPSLAALPPLSLYVHVPWCLRKCPYCDFNSHELARRAALPVRAAAGVPSAPTGGRGEYAAPARPPEREDVASANPPEREGVAPAKTPEGEGAAPARPPEREYVEALVADLEASLPLVWGRRIVSVFIGGGTPSLFSPDAIDRLLAGMRARVPLEPGCEITLEANPGTFERDRFRGFRAAGVTRLSVGVQSFHDESLRRIGRVHDAAQARAAVAEARAAFDTFNIDLMYALPGQTLAMLQADLDAALGFAPPHLSVYHLTLEPNTVFATRPPSDLPDEDHAAAMLDAIVARTQAAGLHRYEVSAFARTGHRCVHNLNYWHFGDYLGIGAGAHGKLSFPDRIVRQVRWREPATYMVHAREGQAVSNEHQVAGDQLPFEFMLNALRLKDGFELREFSERTGLPASAIRPALDAALARGLVECDDLRVRPTARGFDFLSDLQALFLTV